VIDVSCDIGMSNNKIKDYGCIYRHIWQTALAVHRNKW